MEWNTIFKLYLWIRNSYAKGLSTRFPPRTINWFWNKSPEAKPTFLLASKWPKQRLRNGLLFQQSTTIILRPRFLNSSIYHFDILEQVACLDLLSDSNPYNPYQYQNFTTEAFNYRWKFGGIPSVKMYRFQILFFIKWKYTSQNQNESSFVTLVPDQYHIVPSGKNGFRFKSDHSSVVELYTSK